MEYRGNYVASSIVTLLKRLCHRCFQGNFAEIMKPLEAVISYKIPRETLSIVASYIWTFFQMNLIITLFVLVIAFGTMVMLDIIHVTPGSLPLLDEHTWTEVLEHLF